MPPRCWLPHYILLLCVPGVGGGQGREASEGRVPGPGAAPRGRRGHEAPVGLPCGGGCSGPWSPPEPVGRRQGGDPACGRRASRAAGAPSRPPCPRAECPGNERHGGSRGHGEPPGGVVNYRLVEVFLFAFIPLANEPAPPGPAGQWASRALRRVLEARREVGVKGAVSVLPPGPADPPCPIPAVCCHLPLTPRALAGHAQKQRQRVSGGQRSPNMWPVGIPLTPCTPPHSAHWVPGLRGPPPARWVTGHGVT